MQLDGTDLLVKIGSTVIAALTSNDLSFERDMIETTNKDSDRFKTFIPGERGWSITAEALNDPTGQLNEEEIIDLLLEGTKSTVYWGGTGAGDVYYSGDGYIQSVQLAGPKNEAASYSITIQGTGPITKATVGS